mmetsp:Transcript_91494/g.196152  ORF Transcript_91494/g.196152 Transcript_91494/m.196152 type:complete len:126 (-) Transcript_91494:1328-1705(-)
MLSPSERCSKEGLVVTGVAVVVAVVAVEVVAWVVVAVEVDEEVEETAVELDDVAIVVEAPVVVTVEAAVVVVVVEEVRRVADRCRSFGMTSTLSMVHLFASGRPPSHFARCTSLPRASKQEPRPF